MNSIHSVSAFPLRYFIILAAALVAAAFLGLAYQAGIQEINAHAASNSDDFFDGDLGRKILNK
ncbi:hypothetical protein AB0O65_10800 [Microbacterium sp. NPDC077391]|uniref:hypothetical protein n=1 Tax=Microbacterium sp. NPDC077391 TaxID=3154765 RepID=UPI0034185AA0